MKKEMKKEETPESEEIRNQNETSVLSIDDEPSVVIDVEDNVSFEIPQGARVRYKGRVLASKKQKKILTPPLEIKEEFGSDSGICAEETAAKLKTRKKRVKKH